MMKTGNDLIGFDSQIEEKVNRYFEDFKKIFESKKHPEYQKNTYLQKLRKRSDDLESDPNFTNVLIDIRDIEFELDKDQPYFIAIEKFLKKSKRNRNEIINYLVEYYASVKAQRVISDYSIKGQYQIKIEDKDVDEKSIKSTIEEIFIDCKKAFNNEYDYCKAVTFLEKFFLSEQIDISEPLFVKSGNIKNLSIGLGEIWRSQKNEHISYEYLSLYKKLFSIFQNQKVDKKNIFGSNLYKYSISKT